jgi:hypothetical protein
VTRLNTGRDRVVRLAAAAVGVAAIMLVSACGAGQIAETANIKPAVPGGSGSATVPANPNQPGSVAGTVSVLNVTFDYNDPAGYAKGGSAPLNVRIVNGSGSDLVLTGVTATVTPDRGSPQSLGTVTVGPAPTAAPSAPGQPSGAPSPSGSASPSSPPPSAEPTATPTAAPAVNIKIPANQLVDLSQAAGQFLQVSNLTTALTPGTTTDLIFSFTDSSNSVATINGVPVQSQIAPPTAPAERTAVNIAPSGD